MIPLNSKQRLPANAILYMALRSLAGALFLALIATVARLTSDSPNVTCRGALCGTHSGTVIAWLLYLYAVCLVVRAVLNYRWLEFVLTDKSISIESGVFVRNSCTFRYDRIQDIDTYQDPLHRMLGLKSVAIWTSSPDQFAARTRRPNGLLVLEAEDADWLKGYLSDPQTAGGAAVAAAPAGSPAFAASLPTVRHPHGGFALTLGVAAVGALVLMMLWNKAPVSGPTTAPTAGATAAPVTTPAPATDTQARRHAHVRSAPPAAGGSPALTVGFGIACAIRSSDTSSIKPCADLGQARRCSHEEDFPSQPTAQPAQLTVVNRSGEKVNFYWLNPTGARTLYAALTPGAQVSQASHIGAHWMLSTWDGQCIGIFDAATTTIGIF